MAGGLDLCAKGVEVVCLRESGRECLPDAQRPQPRAHLRRGQSISCEEGGGEGVRG